MNGKERMFSLQQIIFAAMATACWLIVIYVPATKAISLGRNYGYGLVLSIMAGIVIFIPAIMIAMQSNHEAWLKERKLAIQITIFGSLFLLTVNFFLTGYMPAHTVELDNKDQLYRSFIGPGRYVVIERQGQRQVLFANAWNYSDKQLDEYPAVINLAQPSYFQEQEADEYFVSLRISKGTVYFPPNEQAIMALYKQVAGSQVEQRIQGKIFAMAIGYLQSLNEEDRLHLRQIDLHFDLPLNSEFSGTGLEVLNDGMITVEVRIKPKPRYIPEESLPPALRTVNTSQLL
ncbi:hypothetical protein ACFL2U_01165 [Patescibacteria group bacterium]